MSRLPILMALVNLLSGCANAPNIQFYVLEPMSQTTQAPIETAKQFSIGVGPISVPELLVNKKILTRLSNNTVQLAEFHQWASPFPDNLLQTITRNLLILQPNNLVRAYPWNVHGTVDRQIIIDIICFDTTPGVSANLEATWSIKNENNHTVLKNGHTNLSHRIADSSYPSTVRALSKILAEFSKELSLALLKIRTLN